MPKVVFSHQLEPLKAEIELLREHVDALMADDWGQRILEELGKIYAEVSELKGNRAHNPSCEPDARGRARKC